MKKAKQNNLPDYSVYRKGLCFLWLSLGVLQQSGFVGAQQCFDAGDCLEDTSSSNSNKDLHHHDGSILDILVLVCTQSFTGEELVEDILLDALTEQPSSPEEDNTDTDTDTDDTYENTRHPPSWSVTVKLVDEAGLDWTGESLQQQSASDGQGQSHLLLSQHADVVLIVASTYGDGDPPNHALQFADWLSMSYDELHDPISYAVFGLGDRSYDHYNQFGIFVDQALERRGGRRLLELHLGDAQQDLSAAFHQWTQTLIETVLPGQVRSNDKNYLHIRANQPQQRRSLLSSTGMDWRRSIIGPDSMQAAFVDSKELLDTIGAVDHTATRSVLHVTLDIMSPTLFEIQPGDHLGIHPRNPKPLVEEALQWLDIDGSILTTILDKNDPNSSNNSNRSWQERKLSAYEFLEQHVDLAGRVTPSTLRALLQFVGTLRLRALARDLTFVDTSANATAKADATAFDQWLATPEQASLVHNKLQLAKWFDCRPSLQALARALGPLQPRLYSIATVNDNSIVSSNEASIPSPTTSATKTKQRNRTTMTRIGLCVSVVVDGLCTSYLATLTDQSIVTVFVKPSSFHFVDDTTKPAILVSAGSGIGPMVGFLQNSLVAQHSHRDHRLQDIATAAIFAQDGPLSHVRLLVGARTPSQVLYRGTLKILMQVGGAKIEYAFSRVKGQRKRHVQELLSQGVHEKENKTEEKVDTALWLWEEIFANQGRVYACGRLEICESVRIALREAAIKIGGMTCLEADRFMEELKQNGQLFTDCWSVEAPRYGNIISSGDTFNDQPTFHNTIARLERHHQGPREDTKTDLVDEDTSSIPAWPSYLRLIASGEFERRLEEATNMFTACVACGRFCEVNRLSPQSEDWGECRIGQQAIVSAVDAHFGEEPCLKGVNGSGTIFFGACNLKCIYCQNWKISAMDQGEVVSDERLAGYMLGLQERGCHNINLVSPTHNILPILRGIYIAAKKGLRLPIVFNSGGYDSVASLRLLEGIVDIYMPDAKVSTIEKFELLTRKILSAYLFAIHFAHRNQYASRAVARKLSKIDNYPEINQAAIKEMHRQVGDLRIDPRTGLAYRGLLVRHLILPNDYGGTFDVADFLTNEVSGNTYTHVMKNYRPEHEAADDKKYGLNRKASKNELEEAHKRARFAGLQRILY